MPPDTALIRGVCCRSDPRHSDNARRVQVTEAMHTVDTEHLHATPGPLGSLP